MIAAFSQTKSKLRRVGPVSSFRRSESIAALGFIVPALVLLVVFIYYPTANALTLSFSDFNLISHKLSFVGFRNYADLFHDSAFGISLLHSLYFAAVVIPLQTSIALGLALLIRRKTRGVGAFRTIYFLPVAIAFPVAASVFRLIYNANYGLLDITLRTIGLPTIDFLSNPKVAMFGIIILGVWKAMGFYMIIFLAGLNNIPDEVYEAAEIDGAGAWQKFFHVTLPLLKRTTAFIVIVTTMDALKIFVPIAITTQGGGPAGATSTVVYFIYKTAFVFMHMGYATAAAMVYFAIVLVISLLQLRIFKSDVEY